MAKGNGNAGDVSFKMLEQLEKLNANVASLRSEMRDGFDRVLDITGTHHRDLDQRVTAIGRKLKIAR